MQSVVYDKTLKNAYSFQGVDAVAVTPSDTVALSRPMLLNLTVEQTLRVKTLEGTTVTLQFMKGFNPFWVTQVFATTPQPTGVIAGFW